MKESIENLNFTSFPYSKKISKLNKRVLNTRVIYSSVSMKKMELFVHFFKLISLGILTYLLLPLFNRKGRRFSKRLNKIWFDSLAIVTQNASEESADFMNYGYLAQENINIEDIQDTPRNMYLHIASNGGTVDLAGKSLLEIGCGKGAGGELIQRKLKLEKYTGIDLSDEHILIANRKKGGNDYLNFIQGDAENLPFDGDTFDVVLNVESSHQYPNVNRFYREVKRVMHSDSLFMYVDFFDENEISKCEAAALEAGLVLKKKTNVTKNVCWALAKTSESKILKIEKGVPKFAQRFIKEWAGTVDSPLYEKLMTGKRSYIHYVYTI